MFSIKYLYIIIKPILILLSANYIIFSFLGLFILASSSFVIGLFFVFWCFLCFLVHFLACLDIDKCLHRAVFF